MKTFDQVLADIRKAEQAIARDDKDEAIKLLLALAQDFMKRLHEIKKFLF